MKYTQLHDGDVVIPRMRGYKMICCCCSLVHRFDFKIVKGQLQFTLRQDRRATAAARRKK